MQPVHIPVIWILPRRECDQFSIKSNVPRGTTGSGHRDQVEASSIHGRGEVHLAIVVIGVEIVLPVKEGELKYA